MMQAVMDRWNNPNEAIRFNKSLSQYVDVQNSPSLQIDSAISFSCWIKRNILDNGQDQVLNKGGDWMNGTCNYGLVFSEGTLVIMHSGGYYIVAPPGVPLDYDWHHYAVTALEGTTEIHFYVDGIEKTCLSGAGNPVVDLNPTSSSNLYLSGINYFSNNTMDELKIYNRILTVDEIKSLFSDLVAYYPFNGNANDLSGNGHNGTVNGGILTDDRFNQPEKAYTFPNLHNNIVLDNSTGLNLETGFTLNTWVKYKNINCGIVGKHNCWVVNGFYLGIDNGHFWLRLGNSVWSDIVTSEVYVEDQWYMVTGVYDQATSTGKVYVNGVLKASGSVLYNNYSSAPITISEASNGCPDGNMPGAIDEVKIYNRALSDAEILAEYNSSSSDLIAYFPFNGNADDESGNGYHGIVNGATLTSDRFNNPNKAYQFNGTGTGTNITLSNSTNLDFIENSYGKPFSLSAWAKQGPNTGEVMLIVGKHNCGTYGGYLLLTQNGNFGFWTAVNGNSWVQLTTAETFSDDNWHHVVAAYDGVNQKIYVDGVLKGTLASAYNSPATGAHVKIGEPVGCSGQHIFNGKLDEIRIYNYALSYAQVMQLYQNESIGLVAYFPFSGNANDESVFANNGTVVGATLTYDRYGNTDSAYNFNGVNERIYVPENSIYDFGVGDFTISSWINIDNLSTARIVSAGFNENDNIWGLGFGTNPAWGTGNRINYFVYSNNDFRDFSSNEITDYSTGIWTFITATKINDQIKFYQNGLPVSEATITYPSNSNSFMSIGCRQQGSGVFDEFLNGKIDEVKIFNISFTDQQIKQMYLETTTAPNLLFPGNDSTLINNLTPLMDWDSTVTANAYRIIIANDSLFSATLIDTVLNSSSFQVYEGLLIHIDNLYWKVKTINDGGVGPWSETNRFNIILTDVEDETQLPTEFALMQNYPNPFNPSTTITYHLPKTANVELKVYDLIGNEIANLVNEEKPAGIYNVQFTMNNLPAGRQGLSSGIYFY
ncbi:MAG: LamG domain-containing protein [Ignavibacterium sp.]|nr:LamG domain-containing protein [Ignavibacterium sp.]